MADQPEMSHTPPLPGEPARGDREMPSVGRQPAWIGKVFPALALGALLWLMFGGDLKPAKKEADEADTPPKEYDPTRVQPHYLNDPDFESAAAPQAPSDPAVAKPADPGDAGEDDELKRLAKIRERKLSGTLTLARQSESDADSPSPEPEKNARDNYLGRLFSALDAPDKPKADAAPSLNEQLEVEPAAAVAASRIERLSNKILEGKLIPAILETAIQSNLSGKVRALIPEAVYSTNGERRLIEPGSRAVGQYQGGIQQGIVRIFVVWTRIITPQGVSVALDSPGTGPLGRSGHSGWTDSHFLERFGASIMLSVIGGVAAAIAGDQASGNQPVISDVQNSFNQSAAIALQNSINIKPTLHKNHGESISIFVARDVDFTPVMDLIE